MIIFYRSFRFLIIALLIVSNFLGTINGDIYSADLSDSVDTELGITSGLDSVEEHLQFWIDASNIDTSNNSTLSDGQKIDEWKDLSAQSHHVRQKSISYQPIYNASKASNGFKPSVEFNSIGSKKYLKGAPVLAYNDETFTIISVVQSTQTYGFALFQQNNTLNPGGITNHYFSWVPVNNRIQIDQFPPGGGGLSASPVGNNFSDNGNIFIWKKYGSTSYMYLNDNLNIKSYSEQYNGTTASLINVIGPRIIDNVPYAHAHFTGKIYETLVFDNAIEAAEIDKIIAYLSKKWYIDANAHTDTDGTLDANDLYPNDTTKYTDSNFVDTVNTFIPSNNPLSADITANLTVWLDATNINSKGNVGITSGTSIFQWVDLSGNGNHAYQTDATKQPKYKSNEYNGKGIVDLGIKSDRSEGTGAYLDIQLPGHASENITMFFVYDRQGQINFQSSVGATGQLMYDTLFQHFSTDHVVWISDGVSATKDSFYGGDGWKHFDVGSGAGDLHIFTHDNSSQKIYYDGVDIGQTASMAFYANHYFHPDYLSRIGGGAPSYNGAELYQSDAHLAEVLIFYDNLSDQDRIKINYYLSKKWGLVAEVDSDGDGVIDFKEFAAICRDGL